MAVYSSVAAAVRDVEAGIVTGEGKVIAAITLQFIKDANDMYVPFLNGPLRGSALLTPKRVLVTGTAIWSTPYAVRRYFENHIHPDKRFWDIRTWNIKVKTYEKMGVTGFSTELKRYMK